MSNAIYLENKPQRNIKNDNVADISSNSDFRNCRRINANELTIDEQSLLTFMGLDNNEHLLEVPKRNRGITSSGISGSCHHNVYSLVEAFGGSQVFGLIIDFAVNKLFAASYTHSCWKTPEGELFDVTGSCKAPSKFIPFATYNCLTRIYPLVTCADFKSNEKKPFFMKWIELGENAFINHESYYSYLEGLEIFRKNIRKNLLAGFPIGDFKISDEDLDTLFSERSAFTGEKLSEIRRRKQAIS